MRAVRTRRHGLEPPRVRATRAGTGLGYHRARMQTIDGKPVYSATDLVGFLECEHLTNLELGALDGHVLRPHRVDAELDRIRKRGEQHEARYLETLVAEGRRVRELKLPQDEWTGGKGERYRTAAETTREAILRGEDVIYQACFFDGTWLGFADFLLRVDPAPGQVAPLGWLYEVADTKLARHAKASALLQMCGYTEALTAIQGVEPLRMHVVLGGSKRETATFRVADHMAYYRAVKHRFESAVAGGHPWPPATYPEPVDHCDVCRWAAECSAKRRTDDHLSLVAGIASRTRQELVSERGVSTRRQLASLPMPVGSLSHTKRDALTRVREQARIQVEGEDTGEPRHELLDPPRLRVRTDDGQLIDGPLEPDKGLLALPPPSLGDLFLDLEGDPFALDDGVDYLFGILEPGVIDPATGGPIFHAFWSRDETGAVTHAAERRAFEQAIDLIMDRWARDPNLHVYHYAPYEPTALKRLMGRYATRELEVDRLLRGRVLVDLYRVVRQGLRASVESYSIKRLEPHYGFEREADLRAAGDSIAMFEEWLELGGEAGDLEGTLELIRRYNRDDVLSTWRLRDWLEHERPRLEAGMHARGWLEGKLPRPGPGDPKEDETLSEWLQEVQGVVDRLTAGLETDVDPATLRGPDHARWLLAQLLTWHRRENKAEWWRYFHQLYDLTDEERVDEAEPLGMLELLRPEDESGLVFRYGFPEQEHDIKVDGEMPIDPRTEAGVNVVSIDEDRHEIVLKHVKARAGIHPRSLVPRGIIGQKEQERSLLRVARWVGANGIDADDPSFRAARDLLVRAHPRVGQDSSEPLRRRGEPAVDAAKRLVMELSDSTLPIQGPPGSGKTYTGARMIVDLVAEGKRVGVTANGHKVIGNLLDAVLDAMRKDLRFLGREFQVGQKPSSDEPTTCSDAVEYKDNASAEAAIKSGEVPVLGGTAWMWAREEFVGSVDVLFIDEAGQFSLANAIAVSPAAKSMVLLGDPQQLDQPTKGTHPPGAERSALAHILQVDGQVIPTMPPERGLFLERTWRMHPAIASFTSELFYDEKLLPEPGNERQALTGAGILDGIGIRFAPVLRESRDATESPDEAAAVASMVDELLRSDATWTDRSGTTRRLTGTDILVVAPYNDHRVLVESALQAAGHPHVRVGTVDKFQGQEAPISIYTMASSTADDAPRGMEFLYSLNRLNVATSRARCLTVVVASPDLVRVQCKTPREMQLANALCRLVEVADAG